MSSCCLIDVGTQQGLLSRLCEVVSNTDGVRGERHTQLNSKSFSTAVSHTCEDEDDFADKTSCNMLVVFPSKLQKLAFVTPLSLS